MPRKSRENPHVRRFILRQVAAQENNIALSVVKAFGLTRASANGYLKRLVQQDILESRGNTKARRYRFKETTLADFSLPLSKNLEEDIIWQYRVLPHLKDLKPNIIDIWKYGFTEMLNNAIDHSASPDVRIHITRAYNSLQIAVTDIGIGIFEKIQHDFHLADPRNALLELSKGKLTSDKKHHSGEGIFYTSRMLDKFVILSGRLAYQRERRDDDDWLIEGRDLLDYHKGTAVIMRLSADADWTWREIFAQFEGDRERFRKTHVPISLSQYAGEALVSRSQAKRILSRFDNFSEVMLDFKDVRSIGQAFADEIFRVFKNSHPNVHIVVIHANEDIQRMIEYVRLNTPGKH